MSPALRQPLTHEACHDVGGTTGGESDNDAHRPRWIGLRPSNTRHGREGGSAGRQMQKISAGKFHFEPPSPFTSLDHFVGEREQLIRHLEAERLGSLDELFKIMAGVNLMHVPYRGIAPALNDLLGGQVQVTFASMPSSIEFIRAGKLRALAVTTATRSEVLPDVPTVGEFVPGYEASAWYGLGAPKATPAEIADKLNKEINAALADPKMKARLADLGGTPLLGSPADFGKLIAEETEKWGKVVKFSGAKPD